MQTQIFVLPLLFMALASADLLKNPDFETPPSNFSKTWKSPFVQLTQNNTLPGWTFEGMVQYLHSKVTPFSFTSFSTSQTKDGILCGPVVDDVVLLASRGLKLDLPWKFMVFLCLFAILSFH
ncbi:hypothetical protein UlMin_013812 [Ulmus minor]